jgi:CelD/BcsL family acetyltransferase involved in cellulose biosynthesis
LARRVRDLRRARRRAEAIGRVTAEVVTPLAGELEARLHEALQVEAAGWKGRRGTAIASDPRLGPFFVRYATDVQAQGILRLCFLRIGGRAAAMQLAIEWRQRFWLLKIGYSEEFARCSPGSLLMLETLRYAARRGLRSYELLGSVEPWTRAWTRHTRACVSVQVYPGSLSGAARFATDLAAAGGRRLKLRLKRLLARPA